MFFIFNLLSLLQFVDPASKLQQGKGQTLNNYEEQPNDSDRMTINDNLMTQ